jgi:hypothetical protein
MVDYNEYIKKLKKHESGADFDRMLSRIEERISRRRSGNRLVLAGALAVLLFAFAAYFYSPARQAGNSETLMSYVFEQESVDGPLLDYVFDRNGTFQE